MQNKALANLQLDAKGRTQCNPTRWGKNKDLRAFAKTKTGAFLRKGKVKAGAKI